MKNTGSLTVETPNDCEIVLSRTFDAPRILVFDALTKPELLVRWFGPRGYSLVVCEIDLRVGGAWRFVLRGPNGTDMGMRGLYRDVSAPERLVYTELYDDFASAGEAVVTSHLAEREGKTTLTSSILYPSQQVRNAVIASGMEHGAAEGYDRLAECLRLSPRNAERP